MDIPTLRPGVSGQHLRFISTATLIDAYLYTTQAYLYLELEVRRKAGAEPVIERYKLALDGFGLFAEQPLYVRPHGLGPRVTVDQLRHLNAVQRGQLRRLIVLLAMLARARAGSKRYSVRLHCLQPAPCEPFDGLTNQYHGSGRALRDAELKRRAAMRNAATQQ